MKKDWFRKVLLLILMGDILFLCLNHSYASSLYVSGSDFSLIFSSGDSLRLQGSYDLIFDVENGLWNGSSGYVRVYRDRGRFSFYAENDSLLEVSSPDAPSGIDLTVSGASYSKTDEFVWLVTIISSNTVTFVWNWKIESWLDKYFLFGVGIVGLIMMVFAPTWVALGLRRNAFQPEKLERIGIAFLLFVVGFGLFISWLWA